MTIAVNAHHFIPAASNELVNEYWLNFATANPQHKFIFISGQPLPVAYPKTNIIFVQSSPKANNALMWKWWLNYTLISVAKKHQANLLVHLNGSCSLRCKIPQAMFVSDFSFKDHPQFFSGSQRSFLQKNIPQFLNKVQYIVTASTFLAKKITDAFPLASEKINTIPLPVAVSFKPIGWKEKEAIKEQYTSGKEYFLFSGDLQERSNLFKLLKAFTFFKTRQKSNMQLVIIARAATDKTSFIERLKTYKYRKEVIVIDRVAEPNIAAITAGAYSFVYPVTGDGTGIFPLQAIQCGVPVIAANGTAVNDIAGEAALYTDPENFEDIAAKMMLLFKDETTRAELIHAANQLIARYNTGESNRLWQQLIFAPIGEQVD